MAEEKSNGEKEVGRTNWAFLALSFSLVSGLLMTVVFGWPSSRSIVVVLMVSGATLLLGGLLGFIFGIPRTLQDVNVSTPGNKEDNDGDIASRILHNTNLEQISDWLTKIIVGVGLTQFGDIRQKIEDAARFVSWGVHGYESPQGETFAGAVIIFFSLTGFLIGYLWTRLFLPIAFRRADVQSLNIQFNRVKVKVSQLEHDWDTLAMVWKQLRSDEGFLPSQQRALDDAIARASQPIRAMIFEQAAALREETWKTNKARMARSIPVFRALVASNSHDEFHGPLGQLGSALKDQENPQTNDLVEAKDLLRRAIERRDKSGNSGSTFYEYNLAECIIKLDNLNAQGHPSNFDTKTEVISLIKRFRHRRLFFENLGTEKIWIEWLRINGVDPKSLE